MSAEERKQILQMVADGKINAEEAANLMRALDESAEEEVQVIQPEPARGQDFSADDPSWTEKPEAPEFEEVRRRARRFSMIPLWVGIAITVLFAWWMFSVQQTSGLNFWFFCLSVPFLFGILLIALGAGSSSARWLYVDVDRSHQHDFPRRITLAFPLPLGFVYWAIDNFGAQMDDFKDKPIDKILEAIALARTTPDPIIVNVDESDKGGERVQVFIG